MYDVLIVGAGITGCFLADELSRYELSVAVLERENDVACGSTMANSAIIHAGNDPEEGTLKARLNLEGSRSYEDICKRLHVPYKKIGSFTVASGSGEEKVLAALFDRAKARGIEARLLSGDEARVLEPTLSKSVTQALELPETAVIGPWETAEALMEEAVLNGVQLFLNREVTGIFRREEGFVVETAGGEEFPARIVVNAAGLYADELYGMVSGGRRLRGTDSPLEITPRRGEYFVLDKLEKPLVSRVIYPVPGKLGKGVLAVPTVHGNVLLGPNSMDMDDKEGIDNTREGLDYVKSQLGRILEQVPYGKVIRNFAGLRAKGNTGDFIIEESPEAPGFINAAGIESPGLSSAPAIASYIRKEIIRTELLAPGFTWKEKKEYRHRKPPIVMAELSEEERNAVIKADPAYGRIVCRCEQISEGEVAAAIRKLVGAVSIKGVKKRVRPGMGRCQGGFCQPEIVKLLARELGIDEDEVAVSYTHLDVYKRQSYRTGHITFTLCTVTNHHHFIQGLGILL